MSSPAPNPSAFNYRGAMLAQATRGPVLLILLGALFALQQAGRLPVSRSWPLFIIAIGVMKLVERMLLGPAPLVTPGASTGGPTAYASSSGHATSSGYRPPQTGPRPPSNPPPPPPTGGAQ